jgi:flagellar hook-associated protein 3 FlgL
MTGTIGAASYGSLASILANTSSLQTQAATLQEQTSTGDIAQNYATLPDASEALSLAAQAANNGAYSQAITTAQGTASAMQTALTQISSVVSSMASTALQNSGTTATGSVTAMAQQAQAAFQQVVSLLNTQNGSQYVFSGADSSNPPIPDAENATSSGMYTQIGAQVQALNTVPSSTPVAQVIANTVSIAASTAPGTTLFSSYLTTPSPAGGLGATSSPVQISATQTVTLGLTANQNAGAVSDPSIAGTGSAINDILRSLAVMANSSDTTAANPDFATLMQNVSTTLTSAGQTLNEEAGAIGVTQDTLTTAASNNTAMQTVVQDQLSGLTNVDMATAISQLQAVNSQLQTSYQVLALAHSLNLASYIAA